MSTYEHTGGRDEDNAAEMSTVGSDEHSGDQMSTVWHRQVQWGTDEQSVAHLFWSP